MPSGLRLSSLCLLTVGALLCAAAPGVARASDLAVTQYVHDSWGVREGLPQDMAAAFAQTADGHVWIGTQEGLARFDGLSFTLFNRRSDPPLNSLRIQCLLPGRDGALWIGTFQGLVRLQGGAFTMLDVNPGLRNEAANALALDAAGDLLVGSGRGLSRVVGDRVAAVSLATGDAPIAVTALAVEPSGTIWIGTNDGLLRRDGTAVERFGVADGLPDATIRALTLAPDGALWIGTQRGLACRRHGALQVYGQSDGLPGEVISALASGADGDLWVGTEGAGLGLIRHGRAVSARTGGPLDAAAIQALFMSPDGDLWIGTFGDGVHRLRAGLFTTYSASEGLNDDSITAVLQTRDGALWVGGRTAGLSRLRDGRVEVLGRAAGLPDDFVSGLYEDPAGTLWVGTNSQLYRYAGGRFGVFRDADGAGIEQVRCMLQDRAGDFWFGTRRSGLFRLHAGRFSRYTTADGLPSDVVWGGIVEDRQGVIWVGTERGVCRLRDGRVEGHDANRGLPAKVILAMHLDADGDIWIGTMDGLVRHHDGRFFTYSADDGLFDSLVLAILEDDRGSLWFGCNRGVFRLRHADLDAFAAGRLDTLTCDVYGRDDGMKTAECNGATHPTAVRDRDGRLWFATNDGVTAVDPRTAATPPPFPPLVIDRVVVSGRRADLQRPLSAPPGSGDLEFHYDAASARHADRIRFRYRLEGYDGTWQEAGGRRAAYYTNIPPGHYRFAVQASNSRGEFGATAQSYAFSLQPHLHQSPWLRGALTVLAILSVVALFRRRVRHVRRRADELAHLVQERTGELQAAKEEAEQATRARGEFLAQMSHEIRTPMNGIIGLTRLAVETGSEAERQEYLGIVESSAHSLLDLINDILDLSKIDAGQLELAREPFDPRRCLREALQPVALRAREKGIALRWEAAAGVPAAIVGDEVRLRQVLINLVGNAVKFTDAGEVVASAALAAAADEPGRVELRFAVRDTGIGIPADQLPRVFEAFKQVTGKAHQRPGGTGLGLSISTRLVAAMGGDLRVESEPGRGTTFFFACGFPVAEATAAAGAAESAAALRPEAPGDAAGLRVLVAEDNAVNQLLMRRLLEKAGYAVVMAENGEAAVAACAREAFDLVLMDVQMPVLDGLQATVELRRREAGSGRRLPVIALTAHAMADDRERCLAAGMDGYVAKPVDPRRLFAAMRELLPQPLPR
ncbi:MAG: two-component regulator propeller domain-containing protein [Candidatus Krumholzibacteriia bacterium]